VYQALALLPADMPLSVLQPFVNAVLRGNTQTVRSSQVYFIVFIRFNHFIIFEQSLVLFCRW
jgi:hypothetical protein